MPPHINKTSLHAPPVTSNGLNRIYTRYVFTWLPAFFHQLHLIFCACTAVVYMFWRSVILTMLFFDNLLAVLKHGRTELYLCCIQYLNTLLLISSPIFCFNRSILGGVGCRLFKVLTSCMYFGNSTA